MTGRQAHTIRITAADERGTPTVASCEGCGATWERPDDDPHADTLPEWGRAHRCEVAVLQEHARRHIEEPPRWTEQEEERLARLEERAARVDEKLAEVLHLLAVQDLRPMTRPTADLSREHILALIGGTLMSCTDPGAALFEPRTQP